MRTTTATLLAAALLLSASAAALAHGDEEHATRPAYDATKVEDTVFGREGNPAKIARTVRIDMSDAMRFTPDKLTIQRGQTVRFVLHNGGQVLHEMVIGTPEALTQHATLMRKFPNMEHAEANMAHVQPGQQGEIVWQFTQVGNFDFACLIPGHFEAGMVGHITVQ